MSIKRGVSMDQEKKNIFFNFTNLRVWGRSERQEALGQGIWRAEVDGAVQVAHVRGLVLVVLVLAPADRLWVIRIRFWMGGRQDKVLGSLLAHRVTRVDPILRLCPNVELVIVFLHFGRCQSRRRQGTVASVLGSSGSAGSAQWRQHRAEQIARLYARLLHVVDVIDGVVVGGGRGVVVVPRSILPRLVRSS